MSEDPKEIPPPAPAPEPKITLTPDWQEFLRSIKPGEFKTIAVNEFDHVILRGEDFRMLARRASVATQLNHPAGKKFNGKRPRW